MGVVSNPQVSLHVFSVLSHGIELGITGETDNYLGSRSPTPKKLDGPRCGERTLDAKRLHASL